jgi:hypothetical protein
MSRPATLRVTEHVVAVAEDDGRETLRAKVVAETPRWYSPWLHLAFPSLVALGMLALAVGLIRDLSLWQLAFAVPVWVLANAVEWRAHRYVLHRRRFPFEVLFDRHTPLHHRLFLTEDMAIRSPLEFRLVLVPAFGVLAIAAIAFPGGLVLALIGQRNLACVWMVTTAAYFVSYELLHLSYHLPPESFVGRFWLVRVLRRHHALHHHPERMQRWKFNVTVPLWDWVRGTIYRDAG